MKKFFYSLVVTIVTAMTAAGQSSYSAFVKHTLSDDEFKTSLIGLLQEKPSDDWHTGADQGIAMFMLENFPGQDHIALINSSELKPLTMLDGYEVARLHKTTKEVGYWKRRVYQGEKALFYKGIPWMSTYCGNPIRVVGVTPGEFRPRVADRKRQVVVEEDDAYAEQQTQTVQQAVQSRRDVVVVNNTIPAAAQQPAIIVYAQQQPVQPVIIQQPAQPVMQQPVRHYDEGPREVIVKTKPHWVDYLNLGLNTVDLGVDIYSAVRQDRYQRENRYMFSQLNQLVRQQRSQPRRSPYYPGYDHDPNDFQGPGQVYSSTGTFVGNNNNAWGVQNTGYQNQNYQNLNYGLGAGQPVIGGNFQQGYGPNGTHYFENGLNPANYNYGYGLNNGGNYNNNYGNGQYYENGYSGNYSGGSYTGNNNHYYENGLNNSYTSNNGGGTNTNNHYYENGNNGNYTNNTNNNSNNSNGNGW